MKKFLVVAAASVTLAACSQEAPEATEVDTTVVEEPAAQATVGAGTYDVTDSEGNVMRTTLNEDGTWSDDTGTGTWVARDGKTCFSTEGEDGEMCWTDSPIAEDGSFTSTSDNGDVVSVTPAAS